MPRYSVATTKDKLSTLIDKAIAGEEVIITWHGEAIVEIRPIRHKNEAKRRGWAWYQAKLDQLPEVANPGVPLIRQIKDEYRF